MQRALIHDEAAGELLAVPGVPSITRDEFELFRALILKETGISLGDSKRALVVARMAKRLRDLGFNTYSEYYQLLSKNDPLREELPRMINCITTNKTSFFREPHHFDFLRQQLVPELQRRAAAGGQRQIRVWSAACSTGEEPYSIALTLREALGYGFPSWDVRILASDIDTEVLATAQEGMYPLESVASVPQQLQQRMFLRGVGKWDGFVQVRPQVRSMVSFRHINFVDRDWPVHTRFDAIFCRNVLIYFERTGQKTLIDRLAAMLQPQGYLFAGHSENLMWLTDSVVSVRSTVYRAREDTRR
jgi:chemotaxis protein methyltransferase CheR